MISKASFMVLDIEVLQNPCHMLPVGYLNEFQKVSIRPEKAWF
jgi:hypothetical protein